MSFKVHKTLTERFSKILMVDFTLEKKSSFPSRFPVALVTFTGQILNEKIHFLCSVSHGHLFHYHHHLSLLHPNLV